MEQAQACEHTLHRSEPSQSPERSASTFVPPHSPAFTIGLPTIGYLHFKKRRSYATAVKACQRMRTWEEGHGSQKPRHWAHRGHSLSLQSVRRALQIGLDLRAVCCHQQWRGFRDGMRRKAAIRLKMDMIVSSVDMLVMFLWAAHTLRRIIWSYFLIWLEKVKCSARGATRYLDP